MNTRKKATYGALLAGMVALTMASCSLFEDKPLEKGTPVASDKEAVAQLKSKATENKGKRFAVEGYLYYRPGFAVYTNRMQGVQVCPAPGDVPNSITLVDMRWGKDRANSVFVPDEAGRDETRTIFYDNEGKPLSMQDKVSVSFSISDPGIAPNEVRIDRIQ